MDILYQLPFPQEVCSKIFMYACKSPHNGLGSAVLKHIIEVNNDQIFYGYGVDIYNKFIENGSIMLDGDGHVVKILVGCNRYSMRYGRELTFDIAHLESLHNLITIDLRYTGVTGDIKHLESLQNLTRIYLDNTDVTGNIEHLKLLQKLTKIYLKNTGVTGNIKDLKSLQNLTIINLYDTSVTGDIEHLKLLQKLTKIYLKNTGVTGNIEHLQSLQNLTIINLYDTSVTGDEEAFHDYRESAGLPYCDIYF